jgi:UDP-N-acetylmuramoyl-tripeptide--D-alanyl-D-alanine ligase
MTLLDSRRVRSVVPVPSPLTVEDLLAATRGRLLRPPTTPHVTGAAVDSRSVTPGSLFVALLGERADGHRFVADAARAGATIALVTHDVDLPVDAPIGLVQVADPLTAFQELARWWRDQHTVRIVGITGSTGKTIAKEITADVLARRFRTLRNEGNLNSESGLPLTLLRLEAQHEVAVLEMSMYTVGEIARLAEIARPEVGVVLAVHPTHLERAGSIERIAQAKSELPRALPADGLAVLNADDPRVAAMAGVTAARVRTFGLGRAADVRATEVVSHGLSGTEFTVTAPWGERRVRSGTPGRHLVPHALAAIAVADWLGEPLDDVLGALAAGSRAPHRMAVTAADSGATVVDDAYNASPVSVVAALDFLAETPVTAGGRRIAVLGDMLELGPGEERLHRDVGAHAAGCADVLVAVGRRGRWLADAARSAGMQAVHVADDADAAFETLAREVAPGSRDVVLLKASRGIALDRAVARLVEAAG